MAKWPGTYDAVDVVQLWSVRQQMMVLEQVTERQQVTSSRMPTDYSVESLNCGWENMPRTLKNMHYRAHLGHMEEVIYVFA